MGCGLVKTALREDLRRGREEVLDPTQLPALVHAVVEYVCACLLHSDSKVYLRVYKLGICFYTPCIIIINVCTANCILITCGGSLVGSEPPSISACFLAKNIHVSEVVRCLKVNIFKAYC